MSLSNPLLGVCLSSFTIGKNRQQLGSEKRDGPTPHKMGSGCHVQASQREHGLGCHKTSPQGRYSISSGHETTWSTFKGQLPCISDLVLCPCLQSPSCINTLDSSSSWASIICPHMQTTGRITLPFLPHPSSGRVCLAIDGLRSTHIYTYGLNNWQTAFASTSGLIVCQAPP